MRNGQENGAMGEESVSGTSPIKRHRGGSEAGLHQLLHCFIQAAFPTPAPPPRVGPSSLLPSSPPLSQPRPGEVKVISVDSPRG